MNTAITVKLETRWKRIDPDAQTCHTCAEAIYFPCAWQLEAYWGPQLLGWFYLYLCDSCHDGLMPAGQLNKWDAYT